MRRNKSNLTLNRRKQKYTRNNKAMKKKLKYINFDSEIFTQTSLKSQARVGDSKNLSAKTSKFEKKSTKRSFVLSPCTSRLTPSKSPAVKRYRLITSPSPSRLRQGYSYKKPQTNPVTKPVQEQEKKHLKPARLTFEKVAENRTTAQRIDDWDFISLQEQDLNISPGSNSEIEEMLRLAPAVLKALAENDVNNVFLRFFRQVHKNSKSINNISFLLWTEVVNWYDQNTSTSMRYRDETKMFWKLGWQLFGGKFLRFMAGYKNKSQIVFGDAERGKYEPEESDMNFAVPSIGVLKDFVPYGRDIEGIRKPGIFNDVMKSISPALNGISCCITFDGKKLKQGLTPNSGDIDILGYEESPSLAERLAEVNLELDKQQIVLDQIKKLRDSGSENVHTIVGLIEDLKRLHVYISENVTEMRQLKQKKEYARDKFIERGGKDWRQGKYVYVISAMHAFIFDINCFITRTNELIASLCDVLVHLQNSQENYVAKGEVDMNNQNNYKELEDNTFDLTNSRKVKQRSEQWFAIRKQAKVTGSTIYKALGLDSLKKQKEHFENVVCGIEEPTPTDFVKKAMAYGSKNEINGIATLVGKVLPVFYPQLEYREEGYVIMNGTDNKIFMVVSPDGSLCECSDNMSGDVVAAVEIKCPVYKIHTEIPERYYLQCISEMEALNTEYLIFLSWTPEITNVFRLKRDTDMFNKVYTIALSIYGAEKPKRPTKLLDEVKRIREDIRVKVKKAEYLGEFRSLKKMEDAVMHGHNNETCHTKPAHIDMVCSDLEELYIETIDITRASYELRRQKATEALVFLCCDLDRIWSKDRIVWSPVCWCPKGYSLSTDIVRKLMEEVLDRCSEAGIHVPCCSFDGQWHNIAVRSVNGNPLTLLQLEKDIWKDTLKIPKNELEKRFKHVENIPQWRWEKSLKKLNGKWSHFQIIICTNGGVNVPKTPSRGWKNKSKINERTEIDNDNTEVPNLSEIVSDEVLESDVICKDRSVLQCQMDDSIAQEIALCNMQDDDWAAVLQEMLSTDVDQNATANYGSGTLVTQETSLGCIGALGSFESLDNEEEMKIDEEAQYVELGTDALTQKNTPKCILGVDDYVLIHALLKADKNANKNGKWDMKTTEDVENLLRNRNNLSLCRDVDIRVIARYLKKVKGSKIREYDNKATKMNVICDILGLENADVKSAGKISATSRKRRNVKSLALLASEALKRVPKSVLNVAFAEYIWPEELNRWKENSPIKQCTKIGNLKEPDFWFYIPEFVKSRNQLEVRCIDSTHLLTRTRRKSCKGGIEGLDNKPWLKVARQGLTFLTPVMVEDIIDPMSMSMSLTHFGKPVQIAMKENGDYHAASLCEDIYNWWRAEDEPGLSAHERVHLRLSLRRRLLKCHQFGTFPAPSSHIMGWPSQLWEALIASIDAKAILYSLSKTQTYNVRAFSSMMGETFFAELTNQDRGCHGTVSADEFGRYISRTIEQMHMRLDPTRNFVYRTSQSTAYKLVDSIDLTTTDNELEENSNGSVIKHSFNKTTVTEIKPRNHYFDSKERKRIKGRKKEGTVSTDRNALQKGSLGVRWRKHGGMNRKCLFQNEWEFRTVQVIKIKQYRLVRKADRRSPD